MTQEEFIKVLDEKGYSYEIEGDKIVVNHKRFVDLRSLTSLPPDVVFNNGEGVNLRSLTYLPPGAEFRNKGGVGLNSLKTLPPDVVFKNGGGGVYLESLAGGWFENWSGNIEGVDSRMLLNHMISKGIFI